MRTDATLVTAAIAGALVCAWESSARACGPDFPIELLADRDGTTRGLHERAFLHEATRLVPAPDRTYPAAIDESVARTHGGPEERALYARGARAFASRDDEAARGAFAAVLALPAKQRQHRSTWAAYMLGRSYDGARWCDDPCTPAQYARVKAPGIAAYRQVRALVAQGFADELGLATSSLGQEARLHLDVGDVVSAVRLYAEQAARGHEGGATSLLMVVRRVVEREEEAALVADAIGQNLLALYLDTRDSELTTPQRTRLWRALLEAPDLAAADQLAFAAYRQGKWELAKQLALRAPDAHRSRWVLGKLALRDGHRAEGQRLLELVAAELDREALQCPSFEADAARARVHGELAVVSLADDEPVAAMTHAWRMRDLHPDALYIAERVLTIAELARFVDTLPERAQSGESWAAVDAHALREILARRLMRAGRFLQAARYFGPAHRTPALAYGAAITRAGASRDAIERATALFAASRLAREHGLEILGTSYGPDWGIYGASFDLSEWRDDTLTGSPTELERARVDASAPAFARRYHYRYIASSLAEAAANALPHRSQAFAATLCHGARDVYNIDAARVQALWAHYAKHGPTVSFSSTFGQHCPAPEFTRARRYLPQPLPNRGVLFLSLGLLATALGAVARWRWRSSVREHLV